MRRLLLFATCSYCLAQFALDISKSQIQLTAAHGCDGCKSRRMADLSSHATVAIRYKRNLEGVRRQVGIRAELGLPRGGYHDNADQHHDVQVSHTTCDTAGVRWTLERDTTLWMSAVVGSPGHQHEGVSGRLFRLLEGKPRTW